MFGAAAGKFNPRVAVKSFTQGRAARWSRKEKRFSSIYHHRRRRRLGKGGMFDFPNPPGG